MHCPRPGFFIITNRHNMAASLPPIPAPFGVIGIDPTDYGCKVTYVDLWGADHVLEVGDYELASLFPDFAHEICYYIGEASDAV